MRGEILLLITTMLAALGWIASKIIVQEMPGDLFIASRFLLAGLVLLPFCLKDIRQLSLIQLAKIAGVGLLMSMAMQVWIHAVETSNTLAEGAFIVSLAMIIAPMVAWLLFKAKPHKAFWIALPIAVLGLMLMTLKSGWHFEDSQLFFLLSSGLLSFHFVINKQLTSQVRPIALMSLQMIVVGISGLIWIGAASEIPTIVFSASFLMWYAISTLITTAARFVVQLYGQRKIDVEVAALIMILEPVWTLVLSMTILGETLAMQKLLGAAVIILALVTYIKLSRKA